MADVPHQTQEDGPPWQEIVAEWWIPGTPWSQRWPDRPAAFFTTDTIACLGGLLVDDDWARLARELDIDFCVGLSQTKRISYYPPFVVMHRWCTKHEDNWPMLFEAILKIRRFPVLHAVVTAVSQARRSRGLKEPFHLMLQVKCEPPDAIVDTPPEVAVAAWWTTSTPWPERPSDFFDTFKTAQCLKGLKLDSKWMLLAARLDVCSVVEATKFRRDTFSAPLAVVRAWYNKETSDWPALFKAIRSVSDPVFISVVDEVAQARRGRGLEGPEPDNVRDALPRDELGTTTAVVSPIKERKLTLHEAHQLADAVKRGCSEVHREISSLIQDTDGAGPLAYKRCSEQRWIYGALDTFVQARNCGVDVDTIFKALRRTGHIQIAREILHPATPAQEGRSDAMSDSSEHGSSPSKPTGRTRALDVGSSPAVPPPEAAAPRQAQENPDAWWTTSTPWPSRPSEFFDTAGINCLEDLAVDNAWILLATELNVDSGTEVDAFQRDPVSPQIAVVRKWYNQGVDDWTTLLKAIHKVDFSTFQAVVREVSQHRGRLGLERVTIAKVKAALDTGSALNPTQTSIAQPEEPTPISRDEMTQLTKALGTSWEAVQVVLCSLLGGANDDAARMFKWRSEKGCIRGADQTFRYIMADKIDRVLVHEAVRCAGGLSVANAVLGPLLDITKGEEHSYAQDNESAHGNSPSEPAAPAHDDATMSEREDDSEIKECVVCMDEKPGAAFVPCGHVCCCFDCATTCAEGGSCPVCRAAVASVLKLYT